jgi:hypothetical protein
LDRGTGLSENIAAEQKNAGEDARKRARAAIKQAVKSHSREVIYGI